MNLQSPYEGKDKSLYQAVTKELIRNHPLSLDETEKIATFCWQVLWETKIGYGETCLRLQELDIPATVVGYFFEKLFAHELGKRCWGKWRGGSAKDEKDLVYIPDNGFSIEIKASGQLGTKIFGNRSFGQKGVQKNKECKDKSGYYITVNFYQQILTLIRFGWIDFSDWQPQKAPTGQMAGLPDYVYESKLLVVPGNYRQNAPVSLLPGIGSQNTEYLKQCDIYTVRELLNYNGNDAKICNFKNKALPYKDSNRESWVL
jgi:hypothetical protein